MRSPICVDASFVVKLVVPEANSEKADRLWTTWLEADYEILAPALLPYEVTSAIRKKVQRDQMTLERGAAAVDVFLGLAESIVLVPPDDLHARAWDLAERYRQPNLYDAYYVALAERLGCRLWSADDHLRRAMPGLAEKIASLSDAAQDG